MTDEITATVVKATKPTKAKAAAEPTADATPADVLAEAIETPEAAVAPVPASDMPLFNARMLAAELHCEPRAARKALRALFGKLPDGVGGWSWHDQAAFDKARDAVAAKLAEAVKA